MSKMKTDSHFSSNKYIIVVLFLYVAVRLYMFWANEVLLFPDSYDYIKQSHLTLFSFSFWIGFRAAAYPLFLKLFSSNWQVISYCQLIISLVAWIIFAISLSAFLDNNKAKLGIIVLVLFMSLGLNVSCWDRVIMTESLTISCCLFMISLFIGLYFYKYKNIKLLILLTFLLVASFFVFLRDINAYFLLINLPLILFFFGYKQNNFNKTLGLIITMVFIIFFAFSNYSANKGKRWLYPLRNVVLGHFLCQKSEHAINFFEGHGMPKLKESTMLRNNTTDPAATLAIIKSGNQAFLPWLKTHGKQVYIRFLLTHPYYTFIAPLHWQQTVRKDWPGGVCSRPSYNLSLLSKLTSYSRHRYHPIAESIENINVIIVILLAAYMVLSVFYKNQWLLTNLGKVALYTLFSSLLLALIVWHGDAIEVPRHQLLTIIYLRFALFLFLLARFNCPRQNQHTDSCQQVIKQR